MLQKIARGVASVGANMGKGALAGAAATGVMTLSSTIEMKVRGREPSSVPSSAAGKVIGVQPRNAQGAKRFGALVHWGYGTAWGSVGALTRMGLSEPLATLAHFASVWGTEVTMLPALDEAPPVRDRGAEEIAVDALHHAIYAAAFSGVWYLLEQVPRRSFLEWSLRRFS